MQAFFILPKTRKLREIITIIHNLVAQNLEFIQIFCIMNIIDSLCKKGSGVMLNHNGLSHDIGRMKEENNGWEYESWCS